MKIRTCAFRVVSVVAASLLVSGSATVWEEFAGGRPRTGTSSSLVDFLYPNGEVPPKFNQSIPNLQLPLRVGLAFVPSHRTRAEGLSEAHKSALLKTVKDSFVEHDFIADIMIIPDTYMRTRGGFDSLDQIARLYGVDVMALVSYEQVGYVEDNWKSLAYWTIVGMYVIQGSEHEVQTFVDTAVFDVASRKLLFRAPGHSSVKGAATEVSRIGKVRKARESGFDQAVA